MSMCFRNNTSHDMGLLIILYLKVSFIELNSQQNTNNNPSNFRICTYVQKWRSSKQGMALTLRDGGAIS